MDDILLSVIIPCYNSYCYLEKTLINFSKQVENDIEFIIIDDCSTDDSFKKIKKFVKQSSLNMTAVENEKNMGPGYSRNRGIDLSRGKYIVFLDADDSFEAGFFTVVRSYLSKSIDCLVFDYKEIFPNCHNNHNSIFYVNQNEGEIPTKQALTFIRGATCGKIYKKDIIVDNDVRFLMLKRNEDMPFTKIAISNCNSVWYTKQINYEYYQNKDSLMHDDSLLDPLNAYKAFEEIYSKTDKKYMCELEAIFIMEVFYSTTVSNVYYMKRKEWNKYIDSLFLLFPNILKNKYLKAYSFRIRAFVFLAYNKMYFSVKALAIAQKIVKKMQFELNK